MSKEQFSEHYTDSTLYLMEQIIREQKTLLNKYILSLTNITSEQYAVLDVVAANKKICQQDVADILNKDKSGINRLTEILANTGYLVKSVGTKNNRLVKYLSLTPLGKEVTDKHHDTIKSYYQAILSGITDEEYLQLKQILTKLKIKNN